MNASKTPAGPPVLTLAGAIEGVRQTIPLLPGIFVFGLAFGAIAAEKGLSLVETLLMSSLVYAGAAQMLALQLWTDAWTSAQVLAVLVVVAAVNLRLVLMGAALYPLTSRLPAPGAYATLATLTDANFVIGSRHMAAGGRDVGYLLGPGVFLWAVWLASTAPGHIAGQLSPDPKRLGLDMIMPIVFAAMAVGMFQRRRDLYVWPVAAGVGLLAAFLIDGYWFIVIGALAGSILAGALRDRP